jgi:aspartate-semialdehyde dehydrogenase
LTTWSPYIPTEEEKMTEETKKLLGGWDGAFRPAELVMTAHCNRVPVRDGHTECASVRLKEPAPPEEVVAAFEAFRGKPQS